VYQRGNHPQPPCPAALLHVPWCPGNSQKGVRHSHLSFLFEYHQYGMKDESQMGVRHDQSFEVAAVADNSINFVTARNIKQ
jgi:hypothetical protein